MIKIKIKSRIKEGKEAPELNYGVHIQQSGVDFSIYLLDLDALGEQVNKYKELFGNDKKADPGTFFSRYLKKNETGDIENPAFVGFMDVKDQNTAETPCLKALNVSYTGIHEKREGQGIAKLMYQLALANSAKKGRPLMPDRLHVEPRAGHIWNSLSNNPDVITTFDKNGRPARSGDTDTFSYLDVENPRRTEPKIDDCSPTSEEPYGVPLNRAYYSDKFYPRLQTYINNFKSFAADNFSSPDLGSGLHAMSHALFKRRF